MKKLIRVGTRESELALTQTRWVIEKIKQKFPDIDFEIIGITTKGDVILDTRLDKIGGKGLFIKEIEHALINGSIDIAVHSMKDMPAELADRLTIAAVCEREDPRDVLVTTTGSSLEELPHGSVVGTSSVRREVQILNIRPDLRVKTLRGNVLTRINKLLDNEYDAIVLAAAGLKRLGLHEYCSQYLSLEDVIPAVGQGALAVEARSGDDIISLLLESVHCRQTALCVAAEREYLKQLNGGCSVPIAAHAVIIGTVIKLNGMFASEDRTVIYRACIEGPADDAASLGQKLAEMIIDQM